MHKYYVNDRSRLKTEKIKEEMKGSEREEDKEITTNIRELMDF